jgi:hypothetical protein
MSKPAAAVSTSLYQTRRQGADAREQAMNATDRPKRAARSRTTESATSEPASSAALRRSTGRDRGEWFALLDDWGAAGHPYREIHDWLTAEHGVSSWWAQKLIVEYEQARGLRDAGIRRDGTFTVGASKTVRAPAGRVFEAFFDAEVRERWLPGAVMHERTSQPGRSARFDWEDGATRINVTFSAMGDSRSQVAVEHEQLPDSATSEMRKLYWRERLTALKALLETERHD